MDIQSIFNAGGTVIKNPSYKKGKKNTQPEYITVSDLESGVAPDGSLVAGIAYDAAAKGNQDILGVNGELDKYINAGLTPNNWENLDKQLADSQSAWSKWGNAIAQTVGSELAIGIPKAFSDLFDVLGNVLTLNNGDYNNPVSQYLEQKQEEFRAWAPIYTDPNLNISNGGLLDAGWWASNIPSVASSLTLLIPSSGAVKVGSTIGKALNVGGKTASFTRKITGASKAINNGKKLNKFQRFMNSEGTANATKLFLENGTTAVLSRAIENYQEARQTYNDMYTKAYDSFKQMSDEEYQQIIDGNAEMLKEQGVDPNNKNEVAKAIAKQSADVTFRTDWLNVGWDVIQMYALRNAWKGLRNAPENSAAVRRAQKDAIKYAGQYNSEAELAALKAKRKFREKAKEWVGDKLYGSKLLVTAEASEGAEEAINYIAQQEGMHFGNVLLGKEYGDKNYSVWENVFNGFDGRLSQYIQEPELWDSAFWGVMGGVVFQGLGGQFRRLENKLTDKKSDTNEESKQSLPWYQLDELPETKRRISEIHARAIDSKRYKELLDRINAGEDIYKSTTDKKVEFTNEYEQQSARDKLKNEYIAKMTLRAMHTGNLDMLKEYLASDEVRKAMVKQGFFGNVDDTRSAQEIEVDSKKYIDDALDRMEKVEEMYDNELIAVNEASAYINKYSEYGGAVPVEYMQIIANNNVNAMLSMEAMDSELIGINERIAQLKTQFEDRLDPNINYEQNIRVGILTNELGNLRAERKRLISDESNSLSNQIAIKEIDKRIESIEDDLTDVELAYATFMSLRYTKDDNGNIIQEDTPEAFAYRDQMIVRQAEKTIGGVYKLEGLETFGLSSRSRTVMDDSNIGAYHTLESDARTTFNELRNISPELDNLYQRKAALVKSIDFTNKDIARTVDEVKEQIGMLHNTMNEARMKAIASANKTIQKLYREYGNDVRYYIYDSFSRKRNKDFKPEEMSDAELAELRDALDVLALTKSYNKSLVSHLDSLFELQDAIKAGQSVENPTSENEISADENIDTDNPSIDGTETITGDESSQTDDIPSVTDPQQTDNRQPTFYAKFRGKNKGNRYIFQSGSHSNTDNGGVAVYDNGDGTFTIDVRDNPSLKKNSNMFSNSGEVDLTRPHEVVVKPIAKRNAKGKLEIVQQGELRNTDTLEAQQEEIIDEQTSKQATEQATEQTSTESEQVSTDEPQNPSTGEGVESSSTTVSAEETTASQPVTPTQPTATGLVTNGEYVIEQAPADDSIRNEALSRFQQAVRENKDVDLDAVAKELIDGYVATGIDRVLAETAVNKSKTIIQRVLERKRKAAAPTMQSSVDDIILTQSSIIEQPNSMDAIHAYKSSVKQLMNQYAKELGIQRINGLLYVNLEDLLRYANSVTTDSSTAGMIYESLKEYLKTDEAKKDFIIMDENTVDNSNFLSNVAKSEEERYLERLGDTSIQRVDINYLVRQAESEEEINQFYDALDSLNVGDKLTYEIIDGRLYIRNEKGQAVGTMPIPRIDPTTGAYIMYNDGWKTDILASNNGSITSSLKDLFTRWFTSNTSACKEINSIIHELAYTNPSKERKAELHKQLVHNSEWKAAITQNYTKNDASPEKLANHLVKLLKFVNQNSSVSQTVRNIQVKKSIENWFKKLNSSYDAVTTMAHGQEFNISVGTISDGELIRIVENDKVQAEQQALPINEAIAGGVNPSIHKIGISDMYNVGMIRVSGMPSQGLAGVRGGNTFVIIPNRSGRPGYVQAFPAEVTDDYISQEAKDIIKTIHGEINRLLDAHAENPSEDTYNTIKEFFNKLLSNKNTNSSLFRGLAYNETSTGFTISLPGTGNFINVFAKAKNGGASTLIQVGNDEFEANRNGKKTKNFSYNDAAARDAISGLINNLRFQISFTYIDSDNRANVNLKGLARRENGKFVISVGNKTWTYHSYNDFMLRNNLVRLNTKPSDDGRSNYSRRGERSQRANQVFEIKIDRVTTSPVESNKESVKEPAKSATPTNIPVTEQVKNILASDSTNKGVDIVRAIIGTDSVFTEDMLKAFQNLGILPKNIKFDAEFNNRPNYENINAETNPATGEVTVGKRWLDMFSNPSSRRQAIRKLIHEELHNKLYIGPGNNHPKNNGYIRSAQQIYDEFKAAIENGELERKGFGKDVVEHLKQYLFEGNENGLEEFLVESLTSEELATALNSIDATFDKKRGAKNLFQKILELMSKVFGWNVRKGSLYEKELHTLRNAMNDNVEEKQTIKKVTIDDNKQQETPTEVKEEPVKEEPVTVEPIEVQKPAAFGKDNSRKMRGRFRSSVTELNTTENYTQEMQSIKEQAIANGTFMKAPNGNPTNLNERQWLQVRTKAFKEWFGDWEKAIIQSKYEPISSNPKFKHSLFRGQAPVPEIDADGNLHLKTKYDSLSKLKTLSFASEKNEALHYGYRVAKNPYIIEINEDYLDNILPKEEYEKEKVESKKPFRYDEEFNEVRLSFNDEIIIPKGQYNVTHDDKTINITDLNSAIAEILEFTRLQFESDRQEYIGTSELEGAISSQDIKEYDDKIIDVLGEKYYNIIAVSELSKDQSLQYYIPIDYNTIKNYINEGYLIEKDYDSFTEKELKTLPLEVIEQIKKELSYYELTDKAKKEIDNAIKSNKTKDNASKVVDENGEPLVVYHGSKSIFTVFDSSKSESRQYLSQQIEPTNFFSSDKTVADFFALTENQSLASKISKSIDIVLDAFAGENIDEDILADEIWTDAANRTGKSKEFVKDFWENKVPREYKKHDEFGTTRMEDPDINKYKYNVFLNMKNPIILDAKGERADRFIEANKEVLNNNDEVIIININETVGKENTATDYLVRNPNQIKSATDNIGTFSTTNNDIRYSSITEQPIKVPSVTSFAERLPAQQQPKFAYLVACGEISTSCR